MRPQTPADATTQVVAIVDPNSATRPELIELNRRLTEVAAQRKATVLKMIAERQAEQSSWAAERFGERSLRSYLEDVITKQAEALDASNKMLHIATRFRALYFIMAIVLMWVAFVVGLSL